MYVTNDWDRLFNGKPVKVAPLADETTATLVSSTPRETDHYGEYLQGEGEISMVFKVGDRFFKKTGYQSSYGDERSWDGPVTEVFPVEQTVVVYKDKR